MEKTVASRVTNYSYIEGVSNMEAAIQNSPMTIAVAANDCWQFYKSGVLSSENHCGTDINHAVVVVGLHKAGDDEDDE